MLTHIDNVHPEKAIEMQLYKTNRLCHDNEGNQSELNPLANPVSGTSSSQNQTNPVGSAAKLMHHISTDLGNESAIKMSGIGYICTSNKMVRAPANEQTSSFATSNENACSSKVTQQGYRAILMCTSFCLVYLLINFYDLGNTLLRYYG